MREKKINLLMRIYKQQQRKSHTNNIINDEQINGNSNNNKT